VPANSVLSAVQQLSAKDLQELLDRRQAEDKALRVLWRAALARERQIRRQQREAAFNTAREEEALRV
jgi:hypothetical protein